MLSQFPSAHRCGKSTCIVFFSNPGTSSPFYAVADVLRSIFPRFLLLMPLLGIRRAKHTPVTLIRLFSSNQCGFEYTQPNQGGGLIPKLDVIPAVQFLDRLCHPASKMLAVTLDYGKNLSNWIDVRINT